MKNRLILTTIALTVIVIEALVIGQANSPRKKQDKEYVVPVSSRPAMAAEYSRVAAIKLASRKMNYRVGEMITIDVALLNVTDKPLLFPRLELPSMELKIRSEEGKEDPVVSNTTVLEGITSESYVLLPPHEVLVRSVLVTAQCSDKSRAAYVQARAKLDEDEREGRVAYQQGLFDRNLFINWGEGCLNISRPGTYFITAISDNNHVVISPVHLVKTAVGRIQSSPLVLTIVE